MSASRVTRTLALMLLAVAGSAGAQAVSLAGAWTRISLRDSSGNAIQPPVAPAFVIFSTNGHFSQTGMPTGRPKVDKALADMTKAELLARFDNVEAWRGTYTIAGNRLTRKTVADVDPSGEGVEFIQFIRVSGDTLILTWTNPANHSEARFVRVR